MEATRECPSTSVRPACELGAASAVIPLVSVGVNLLPQVLNSGQILELNKGGKMPVAAFVTRLGHQQRERILKMN